MRNAKEDAQRELDKHMSDLNVFKLDENKWREIEQKCKTIIDCLDELLCKFKETLLHNEFDSQTFKFEFHVNIDVNPLFEIK